MLVAPWAVTCFQKPKYISEHAVSSHIVLAESVRILTPNTVRRAGLQSTSCALMCSMQPLLGCLPNVSNAAHACILL